ncbi:MAG: glutaminase domain-containing protein [Candidatus Cryptobacteroides sp.]
MKNTILLTLSLAALAACGTDTPAGKNSLRAPAYPLVSIDPYTSAWSASDELYGSSVQHWTGKEFPLIGALKVDGEVYRFMGIEDSDLLTLVPVAQEAEWTGKYTEAEPKGDWTAADYNDKKWSVGKGCFGTPDEKYAQTLWESRNIWVRREIELPQDVAERQVFLYFSNDDRAIFYINGEKITDTGNTCNHDAVKPLGKKAMAALKPGRNVLSATCENTGGLAVIDFGLKTQAEKVTALEKTAVQTSVDVQPTQTHYTFACGPVDLKLSFTAPLFLDNLDLVSRPVNYIRYEVASNDGADHEVSVYFEASPKWASDKNWQETVSEAYQKGDIKYLKAGTKSQEILAKKGDDLRIDWGYFYLASAAGNAQAGVGRAIDLRNAFKDGNDISTIGTKGENNDGRMAVSQSLGLSKKAAGSVMIGYDDIYSIQYFGENLRPYWNRKGDSSIEAQFEAALKEETSLVKRCYAFDRKLMADAEKAGGRKYAELCALAYRQAIHAHKLVESPQGDILWLSKENNSNGSIGTVDVTYPSAPLFLLYNPTLAEGLMNHIYYYSESGRWTKPFPAHDVGTYPLANGQTYGGDMPVEEAGNMLSLTAAVCHYKGNADYALKHWETLTTWVQYLEKFGLDPENQLCTDDFAGHFAHNANLSIKAILAIASYGYMADMLGKDAIAESYFAKARELAKEWMKMADDGDHYRLTFDKPGTWSQKYNLVWDKLLGLHIFPDEVRQKEIAYYLTKQNEYGLPLDSRETYTKTDWILWTATMADSKADFEALVDPVHKFENETVDRVPMSDWVFTDKPNYRGFKARSVVGGYFIKMLDK